MMLLILVLQKIQYNKLLKVKELCMHYKKCTKGNLLDKLNRQKGQNNLFLMP